MSHQQPVGVRECKSDLNGESRTYYCPRDEYCCNIGCCSISPAFQFYQLWYYWFMVLFMFLLCSGGQWWYRYVVHGRCASAMPPPPRRASYPRQCRVAYTPARDTVVLHQLWKPSYNGMHGPPPTYSQSGASSSSGGGGPKLSPYMQLYGPPPSYESVFGSGPAPIHQHSSSGSGQSSFGVDQRSLQLSLDQRDLCVSLPPHHRQGSAGGGTNLSQLHTAAAGGSSQAVALGLGPAFGQNTQNRRCYALHHHHHQHVQKAVLEPNREDCQDSQPDCVAGSQTPIRPNQTVQDEGRSPPPSQEVLPPSGISQSDPELTVIVVPLAVISNVRPSTPEPNTSVHST